MNVNKFKYLNKVESPAAPAGDRYETDYKLVKEDNTMTLVEVGKIDVQEKISSYENGVSLARLIARYQAGDVSAFEGDSGFYGDVTGMPTSLQDVIKASRENYQLIQSKLNEVLAQKAAAVKQETASETLENEVKKDA